MTMTILEYYFAFEKFAKQIMKKVKNIITFFIV